jgi:hypothetical protein
VTNLSVSRLSPSTPEAGELYDDETMKLVLLHYPVFDEFITFYWGCYGRFDQHLDTAQQIERWLTGRIDITFH